MSSHHDHVSYEEIERAFKSAPINWVPAVVLISTPILAAILVPWYLWHYDLSWQVWAVFAFFMTWTGMGITAGYHRLMSHRAYSAHPVVKYFLLLGATLAIESSAYDWCSGHREHHRHVDDEHEDPYSSSRGFFFSHMGWMLKKYPSGIYDYRNIPDLKTDKVLDLQHKYYGFWVVFLNVGIVSAVGLAIGDVWGTLLIAGLLRIVLTHHFTFFINSLSHMYGKRPYTDENTARDNAFLAFLTWGEGYHNYHHHFQYDYRNGIKWWQYDPTKWLIFALSKIGLAKDLRKVDDVTIKHAELTMQFKRAQKAIDKGEHTRFGAELAQFADKIGAEYDAFKQTVEEWQAVKRETIRLKKTEYANRLAEADEKMKTELMRIEQKIIAHSQAVENAFGILRARVN